MISHHDQCLFVHVPKTAGQSIQCFFLNRVGLALEDRAPLLLRPNDNPHLGPPRLSHLKAHEYVEKKWMTPQQFEAYYRFSFVRNPWDRTASFYRTGYDRVCSFSSFVRYHLPRLLKRKPWFFGPQADFIYDGNGRLLVEFVGRYENLADDFRHVCTRLGIEDATLPHANDSNKVGRIARLIRRRPRHYTEMYDDRSLALVEQYYGVDIDTFKYRFQPEGAIASQRLPGLGAVKVPAIPAVDADDDTSLAT